MAKDKRIACPLNGFKACIEDGAIVDGELVSCKFWINVQGRHPQSGETVNSWDCSFIWAPVLMIENSKVNRETGAAIESFRNEMVKANEASRQLLLTAQEKD
jgi:hypothetical protein